MRTFEELLIHLKACDKDIELLKCHVDVSKQKEIIKAYDKSLDTALLCAVKNENTKMVELLLDNGACVNACNENGDTALMRAAMFGNLGVVALLISRGANINARDKRYGDTTITIAKESGSMEIANLIAANIDFMKYATNGDVENVRRLVKSGLDLGIYGNRVLNNVIVQIFLPSTWFFKSKYKKLKEIAKILISNGCEADDSLLGSLSLEVKHIIQDGKIPVGKRVSNKCILLISIIKKNCYVAVCREDIRILDKLERIKNGIEAVGNIRIQKQVLRELNILANEMDVTLMQLESNFLQNSVPFEAIKEIFEKAELKVPSEALHEKIDSLDKLVGESIEIQEKKLSLPLCSGMNLE